VKTIWKFPLSITDQQQISMPEGAEILSVQVQRGQVCLWALVNPNLAKKPRTIEIFGTGHEVDDSPRTYIGTVQVHPMGSDLVWHVFSSP
jgi:hypothetical protein